MLGIICGIILSFFGTYPKESSATIEAFKDNRDTISTELSKLSSTERTMALAVVAPEYSQFSKFLDFVELRALYVMYLNEGVSDFSVGPFQMKPSFIENMEKIVQKSTSLKKKFSKLLPNGTVRDQRKFRLNNLATWSGQLRYLELFIVIVKEKTKNIRFDNEELRLKRWATIYNSGINLDEKVITHHQYVKQFPKVVKNFNYSDVAIEFFEKLREYDW